MRVKAEAIITVATASCLQKEYLFRIEGLFKRLRIFTKSLDGIAQIWYFYAHS
jgi:hypothetical protein